MLRGFVVPLLLYVTLDLAVPMVPGAFVFDAEDSVETAQGGKRRAEERTVALVPAPAPAALVATVVQTAGRRPAVDRVTAFDALPSSALPRAHLWRVPPPADEPY